MLAKNIARRTTRLALCLWLFAIGNLAANEIRIGAVSDQSGIGAEISRDYLAGARTYFDHINATGGIRGRKLSLIVKDDEGVPGNTLRLTRELISGDRVDALFGFSGDENLALISKDGLFRSSKVILYGPLSGIELGDGGDSIVFVRPTYRAEVRHIIQHFSQLQLTHFTVVHFSNDYGVKLAQEVSAQVKAHNRQLSGHFEMSLTLRGLDALVRNVAAGNPQVIIVAADTIATAEFVKKLRALDRGVNVVALSTVNHRTLMEMAKADFAAGTMITQVVPNPMVSATKLQTEHLALMAKYRDEPPSHLTLEGFMAAKGLVKALKQINGEINRTTIAAALSGIKRYDLDGMTLAFGPENDRGSRFVDIAYLRKSGRLVQ